MSPPCDERATRRLDVASSHRRPQEGSERPGRAAPARRAGGENTFRNDSTSPRTSKPSSRSSMPVAGVGRRVAAPDRCGRHCISRRSLPGPTSGWAARSVRVGFLLSRDFVRPVDFRARDPVPHEAFTKVDRNSSTAASSIATRKVPRSRHLDLIRPGERRDGPAPLRG